MSQQSPASSDTGDWKHAVLASGPAGKVWLQRYQEENLLALERLGLTALTALRQGQKGRGHELLEELEKGLSQLVDVPASIRHIHDRWYYGVLAYYEYVVGNFARAEACLQRAYEAIRDAIEEDDFLVVLANHCQEFRLHQARIARNRLDWDDVRHYVDQARKMIDGQTPLCELRSGKKVFLEDMKQFCASLPREGDAVPFLAELLDDERHLQLFENFVQGIYLLPGFVLTYP